jgi:hypothetical protein
MLRMSWPTLSESEKAIYRRQWAEQVKPLLPAPAPVAAETPAGGARRSSAELMAEQNRRHQAAMRTNDWMMDMWRIKFNTQANWSGSPYRYW